MIVNWLYRIGLIGVIIITWSVIYQAQFLEYDLNWSNLLSAFALSCIAFITIISLFFFRRRILLDSKIITILYLIINSPITIAIVIINYHAFFNTTLKH